MLVKSRVEAKVMILAGKVYSTHGRVEKPGILIYEDTHLWVKHKPHNWVSRGGLKLSAAFKDFSLDPTDNIVADIGASTGGFTDVLLHMGAAKVYAVDVGKAQLDYKLRKDPRVISLESQNARYLNRQHVPDLLHGITIDVSFIGLEKVLLPVMALTRESAWIVALIKPQFQLSKDKITRSGVVTDPHLHRSACKFVVDWIQNCTNWVVLGVTKSPILGAKGNREFLISAVKGRNL